MFGDGDESAVTCIACGTELPRSDAREYDKEGDRWNREDKQFEYLCKACDRDRSHQPRRGLEETLLASGAGEVSRSEFLASFQKASLDRHADEQ
jgi:hypothetical protein